METIQTEVVDTNFAPGTRHIARAELHATNATCSTWCETPFVTAHEFVPASADGAVDVESALPAGAVELRGAVAVVVQPIEVARSGRVVNWKGLALDERYRMELTRECSSPTSVCTCEPRSRPRPGAMTHPTPFDGS